MTEQEDTLKNFEWHDITPGKPFYDQLEKRFFIDMTSRPLKIGFSHNARRVEMIAIADAVRKDPKLEVLEGKIVKEEGGD